VRWSEWRGGGRVVFAETMPGIVTVVPEWMLDPIVCAGMTEGTPQVTVEALINLQRDLLDAGFRRSSEDDPNTVRETQHEPSIEVGAAGHAAASTRPGVQRRKTAGAEPGRTQDGGRATGRSSAGGGGTRGRGA
jgi:hypothetical protein